MEKYYKDLLKMPAVKSTKNPDGTGTITESTVNEIHKVLRSCFRQAVKWDMMEKNPAVDATVPKAKKQEREIWTCLLYTSIGFINMVAGTKVAEKPENTAFVLIVKWI